MFHSPLTSLFGLCLACIQQKLEAGANLANSTLSGAALADSFYLVSCKPFSRHLEAVQQTRLYQGKSVPPTVFILKLKLLLVFLSSFISSQRRWSLETSTFSCTP